MVVSWMRLPASALIRRSALVIMLCIASFPAGATRLAGDSCVSFTVRFPFSSAKLLPSFADNRTALDSLAMAIGSCESEGILSLSISGSSSPEGNAAYNRRLAERRARALADYVAGLSAAAPQPAVSSAIGHGPRSAWAALRSATVVLVRKASAEESTSESTPPRQHPVDKKITVQTTATTTPIGEADTAAVSNGESGYPLSTVAESSHGNARPFYISTNLLYDAAITPNIGIGIYLGRNFSLNADWMYAWWSRSSRHRYWRIYGGDVELRRHFNVEEGQTPFSGHHIGIYASFVTYDFQFGNHTGVLADKFNYATGISYGYTLPLRNRLSLEFSVGVGYLWGRYEKHRPIDDHDVWQSTHRQHRFGPTRAGISLVWLLGGGNTNRKKGGSR